MQGMTGPNPDAVRTEQQMVLQTPTLKEVWGPKPQHGVTI